MTSLELSLCVPLISALTALLILGGSGVGLPGTGRRIAVCGLLLSLGALIWAAILDGRASPRESTVSPASTLFFLSDASQIWLFFITSATLLILAPSRPGRESTEAARRESFAAMAVLATLQCAVLLSNPWWQWGALSLAGWLFCGLQALGSDRDPLAAEPADAPPAEPPLNGRDAGSQAALVWFAAADLGWFFGLLILGSVLPLQQVAVSTSEVLFAALPEDDRSLASTAATLMLFSLTVRCGLFPLMSWTQSLPATGRGAAWAMTLGLGQGLLLLAHWHPLMREFREPRMLLAGVGGLSVFLLSLAVWGMVSFSQALVRLAGLQLGLLWLGLAGAQGPALPWLAMGQSSVLLLAAIALSTDDRRSGSPGGKWGLVAAAALLCCGALGQERLAEPQRLIGVLDGAQPGFVLGLILAGQTLACYALFRGILAAPEGEPVIGTPARSLAARSQSRGSRAALAAMLFALGITGYASVRGGEFAPALPLVNLVLLLIGIVAAWTWPAVPYVEKPPERGLVDSLQRLGREDMYLPLIADRLGAFVRRGAAWLTGGVDDGVVRRLSGSAANGLNHLSDAAALAEEETAEPRAAVVLLIAAAVLALGFCLGRV